MRNNTRQAPAYRSRSRSPPPIRSSASSMTTEFPRITWKESAHISVQGVASCRDVPPCLGGPSRRPPFLPPPRRAQCSGIPIKGGVSATSPLETMGHGGDVGDSHHNRGERQAPSGFRSIARIASCRGTTSSAPRLAHRNLLRRGVAARKPLGHPAPSNSKGAGGIRRAEKRTFLSSG